MDFMKDAASAQGCKVGGGWLRTVNTICGEAFVKYRDDDLLGRGFCVYGFEIEVVVIESKGIVHTMKWVYSKNS